MSIGIPESVSLTEGEVPIWFDRMSWIANWPLLLLALIFVFTLIGIFLSVILVIIVLINVTTSEYFISNKRIYFKYGLISRVANDIKMEWVTNISIRQGFFGRILNYGDVLISSPGIHTGISLFRGVRDPILVKGIIDERIVKFKKIEEVTQSLRTLNDEFKMGRIDEFRYFGLKNEYENELNKYNKVNN